MNYEIDYAYGYCDFFLHFAAVLQSNPRLNLGTVPGDIFALPP